MSWDISYDVRPADPMDRRDHPDAHEVRMLDRQKPIRLVGVWKMKHQAEAVAEALNRWAGSQIR